MGALIAPLVDQLWPYLLAAVGALLALWRVYSAGRKAERARQAEAEAEARDIRDAVQNDVGAMPPSKVRDELSRRAVK
jgi:hypothetical protein